MKLYLGVDLHKTSCWVTVMNGEGRVLDSQRLGTERGSLLSYFGQVEKPAALAVEAAAAQRQAADLKSAGPRYRASGDTPQSEPSGRG